jgi:hypothetical protein
VALRDLAGVSADELAALARLGAAAYQGQRFGDARRVFEGLAALEPDRAVHQFHLALAAAGEKDTNVALAALARYFDLDDAKDPGDVARALMLRVQLCHTADRPQAEADYAVLRALAERSPSARRVLEGGA